MLRAQYSKDASHQSALEPYAMAIPNYWKKDGRSPVVVYVQTHDEQHANVHGRVVVLTRDWTGGADVMSHMLM